MLKDFLKINWQFLILCLLVVLIPYGINCWPYAPLWLFLWFYSGEYKKFTLPKQGWFWMFCSFYILHLIGIIYSDQKGDGMDISQSEIGFLYFPVLLSTYSLKKYELQKILRIFCFSNVVVAGYLILRAVYYTLVYHDIIFTYSIFSGFIHPSYSSLYFTFSIAILFLGGFQLSALPKKDFNIKLSVSILLVFGVLFCSSKIGLIALVLLILFLSGYFIVKFKNIYYTSLLLLISFSICFIFIKYVPSPLERFNNVLVDYNNTKGVKYYDLQDFNKQTTTKGLNKRESILARIFIWDAAIPVIKQHLLFGVGPGDATMAMASSAENKGISTFDKYNMHNQYIETQMGLGLLGLLILLLLTFGILIYSIVKKDLLLGILVILVILSCSVESMFRMDYFSLFYSLFAYLFIKANVNKKNYYPEFIATRD